MNKPNTYGDKRPNADRKPGRAHFSPMTPDYLKQLDASVKFASSRDRCRLCHVAFGVTGKRITARAASTDGMTIAYAEGATIAACLKALSKKL